MISDAVLAKAVSQGLVSDGQALALRSLARQEEPLPDSEGRDLAPDPERLRFVSGFADIFVTLGLVLFLGSAAYLAGRSLGDGATAGFVAVLAWGLAEFFSRVRRMALPSIVLLGVFAFACFLALAELLGVTGNRGFGPRWGGFGILLRAWGGSPLAGAAAALGTAALVALHYWRFRVPVTVAAGVAALLAAGLLVLYAAQPAFTELMINPLLLGAGVVAFFLAMRFDMSDPERATRRTDIAFWLHLLAAPLIVHSLFEAIGAGRGIIAPGSAGLVLALFAALGVVAILVDRRALLVSGLVYAGIAFGSLISRAGIGDTTLPLTLLALGALVLALSAGWMPLRRRVLDLMPSGLTARLPRPTLG